MASEQDAEPVALPQEPQSPVSSRALTSVAINLMSSSKSPKYLSQGKAKYPFPYYHPLTGKPGTYVPGSQYWQHPPDLGPHDREALVSTMAASYKQRPESARKIELDAPFTFKGHGKSTGFCPNYSTIRGVSWAHQEQLDTFRTTYNDFHSGGRMSTPRGGGRPRR